MNDIVERLRAVSDGREHLKSVTDDAIAEIQRLRAGQAGEFRGLDLQGRPLTSAAPTYHQTYTVQATQPVATEGEASPADQKEIFQRAWNQLAPDRENGVLAAIDRELKMVENRGPGPHTCCHDYACEIASDIRAAIASSEGRNGVE